MTELATGIRALQQEKVTGRGDRNCGLRLVPHVVELNMLMRTRQRVTSRTILAGTMSGGMKKETQDIATNWTSCF